MSFDPSSIVSAIQNCITLYNYASDVRNSSAERAGLLKEVHSLQSELEALQQLVGRTGIAGDPASMARIAQVLDPKRPFAKVLDETLVRAEHVLSYGASDPKANKFKVLVKRGAAALRWPVDKAEVMLLFAVLERYKSEIARALAQDTLNHIITDYCLKVAKFISEQDFNSHQRTLIEQRLPETGEWLLQHAKFVAWRDNEDSERTVWCHGLAGVGKSVIAALIVEHLRSVPGTIVLSVFCRYTAKDTLSTTFPVLRGLLRQLIEKSAKVPHAVAELYRTRTDPEPNSLSGFLDELAVSHAQPIYIVIDALDECPIKVDLLRAVQALHPSFRILVTSRPVFDEIHEHSGIEIHKHSTIKISATEEDILTAVDTTLRKLKYTWLDKALKSKIRAKVVEKAGGMFLLASLQLYELEHRVTCQDDVDAILNYLPRTLDEAYTLTFQRIREQVEERHELACRTLALISLMPTGFNCAIVQHLLAAGTRTRYTDIEIIIQCCHGLVQRGRFKYLEFIHYSVYEYITKNWSQLFLEHPNRTDFCLTLGFSTLHSDDKIGLNVASWCIIVRKMKNPEELKQVISFLSKSEVGASLVHWEAELAPFAHDPLLIACYFGYWHVVQYMIQTEPRDVQRFNDALRVSKSRCQLGDIDYWMKSINAQRDMQVNSDRGKLYSNHIITEYRLKIAEFISKEDFTGHQRSLSEQRLPETGEWLLRHPTFVAWRDDGDWEGTVWCHGVAGVGKSVIAALIVEHLRSTPDNIVLSVFCRYSSSTFTTPFPVLRGLLRQLIEKSPKVPPALDDLYRSQTDPEPKALPGLLADLAASHARPIYIVIDALDECPIGVDLLRAVEDLHTSFRILVTSRPVFGEIHEHSTIEIRAADEDIVTAVDTTLRKLTYTWLDEALKRRIRAKVVDKASGMFLLASLQLYELEHCVTCQEDVDAILNYLPRTLDEAYMLTFQRIREQSVERRELACRALALIISGRFYQALHVQHLLAEGDTNQLTNLDTILQCCNGLLQKSSSHLQFMHYSMSEYTTARWSQLFPEHPNRMDLCLKLGFSTLRSLHPNNEGMISTLWKFTVHAMSEPEELNQVVSLLPPPPAKASLVEYQSEGDPLLIAQYPGCWQVIQHMIQAAPPDIDRSTGALPSSQSWLGGVDYCIKYINKRLDVRVNSDGVVEEKISEA